jgi:predicted lipoprotein with Yx(FWY)xxD motif
MRRWLTCRSRFSNARTAGLRWMAIVCVGAVALSAYGLVGPPAFASAKSSSAPKVSVRTRKLSGVGTVYVDARGRTLYTLTNAGQSVACTGACVAVWPPLLIPAGSTPKGAKGVTGLGLVPGGQQVTAAGLPLYRFSGDSKAGQANGEGISSFGGTWHVVREAGTGSSTGGNQPSSSGGSGYGY